SSTVGGTPTERFDYLFSDHGGPATPTNAAVYSSALSDHMPLRVTYDVAIGGGAPTTVPGIVQAEDFDPGGERVAYHDVTPGNQGGAYRTGEDVDIEATTDVGGGYNVGWIRASEWMHYTVNVTTTAVYDFLFRVAAESQGGTFHVEVDGTDVTGS